MWNFFTEMTSQSLSSIVGRGDLIRKIKIPRWMIVFSSSISALINLAFNLVVVVIAMLLNHVHLLDTLPLVLLIIAEVYILALGTSLFLSAAFVKFRDVQYIWEVMLQAGFYLTPILYAMSLPILAQHVTVQKLILLNPMAQAIQDARYSAISHDQHVVTTMRIFGGGWYALIPFAIVAAIFLVGISYFRKESKYFAENI
jgi:ABC-2 type transport system permease protein